MTPRPGARTRARGGTDATDGRLPTATVCRPTSSRRRSLIGRAAQRPATVLYPREFRPGRVQAGNRHSDRRQVGQITSSALSVSRRYERPTAGTGRGGARRRAGRAGMQARFANTTHAPTSRPCSSCPGRHAWGIREHPRELEKRRVGRSSHAHKLDVIERSDGVCSQHRTQSSVGLAVETAQPPTRAPRGARTGCRRR